MVSRVSLALLGGAFLFWFALPAAQAAIFNIADGDVAAFASAITTANSNGEDDTINLAVKGTYTLTVADNNSVNGGANGLPVIANDPGHLLTINGNGATIARSSAANTPAFRIFKIASGIVNISSVTVRNGLVNANSFDGGGIYVGIAFIALSNCNFFGNIAADSNVGGRGGAIYFSDGTLTLTNCGLSGNSATGPSAQGGALLNESGKVTVSRSTFSANLSGATGGAIDNFGTLTVINSTIANNTAPTRGAGIESRFSGNHLTLVNATINGNVLSGNSAGSGGGGITFSDNGLVVRNTIIAGNSAGSGPDVLSFDASPVTSNGHNLIGKINGSTGWVASDLTGTTAMARDPKLVNLQNNGGPAQTMALQPGSEAIDAGDDNVLGAPDNLTSDERGFPRRIGSHVDIGAYELDHAQTGATLTVNTTLDDTDGMCGETRCTLRDALNAANAAGGGDSVLFAPGVTGTISLSLGELSITKAVSIVGPGARVLAVDANLASRVLNISAPGGAVTISGLTLTRGQLVGDGLQGGGIFNGATTTFTNCTISNSSVAGDAGKNAFAGGIYNGSALTLIGCTVSGNSAVGGSFPAKSLTPTQGGSANGGGIFNAGTLTLRNCTFSANTAQGGRGGGSLNARGGNGGDGLGGAIWEPGTMTVTNCTFSANAAVHGSGGVGTSAGNNGAGQGGGLFSTSSADQAIANTLVAGNTAAEGGPDVDGTFDSKGFNVVGQTDRSVGFNATEDKTGTVASPLDPKIASLANNGGPTDTMALLVGSTAINAGNDANAPVTDQRGASRAGVSDIGAFEFNGILPAPTPTPTPTATPTPTPGGTPTPTPGSLGNVSTRLQVGTGNNVLFAGFIIQGNASKTVLIRSAGPSLTQFGVPGALGNPQLELHDANNTIGTNDNWQTTQIGGVITSDQAAAIQNSGAPPLNPAEPAIIATLPAGSYSAIVQGVGGTQGVATVEVYDLSQNNGAILANISTRGFIQTGDNVMIGGFIVVGQSSKVLIRATGPSLIPFGINNALANPRLELHDGNGVWRRTMIGRPRR